jgi:hypothetical protein
VGERSPIQLERVAAPHQPHDSQIGGIDMFAAYSLSTPEIVLLFSIGFLMFAFPTVAVMLAIFLVRRRDRETMPTNPGGAIDVPKDFSALPVA